MLGKLLKHELKATSRLLIPLYLILIGISFLNRIMLSLQDFNWMMKFISNLLTTGFLFILVAVFAVTVVLMITRFYKNLIGDEGYLMFTLPVKPNQLITSKLIISIFWIIIGIASVIVTLYITFATPERMDFVYLNLKEAAVELRTTFGGSLPFVVSEFILLCIVSLFTNILMLYLSIAIGQLFNGRRILGSFIAYIGIYTALQIYLLIGVGVCILFNWDSVNNFNTFPPAFFPLAIFMLILCCFGLYGGISYILNKKLNLE